MLWTITAVFALLVLTYVPGIVWRLASVGRLRRQSRGKLVLTFDDGPAPVPTPQILDMLDRHHAKATFFVLGNQVAKHPELCDRMFQAGHDIGSHSYSHTHGWKDPVRSAPDIARGIHAVSRWQRARAIYRQPFGKSTLWTLLVGRRLHADPVWWTVDSGDSWVASPTADPVVARLEQNQGGVVLLHDYPRDETTDGGAFTIELTGKLLELATKRGWQVCTISELLYDSAPAAATGSGHGPGVADGKERLRARVLGDR
jgi:peptidoglycan/xylan/chitin deacetylase (PgdA/CDA1 family)